MVNWCHSLMPGEKKGKKRRKRDHASGTKRERKSYNLITYVNICFWCSRKVEFQISFAWSVCPCYDVFKSRVIGLDPWHIIEVATEITSHHPHHPLVANYRIIRSRQSASTIFLSLSRIETRRPPIRVVCKNVWPLSKSTSRGIWWFQYDHPVK